MIEIIIIITIFISLFFTVRSIFIKNKRIIKSSGVTYIDDKNDKGNGKDENYDCEFPIQDCYGKSFNPCTHYCCDTHICPIGTKCGNSIGDCIPIYDEL